MRSLLFRLALVCGFACAGFSALPAAAAESGTLAWTITALNVFEGPGTNYDQLGNVAGKVRIRVDRCTYKWCQIHGAGARGWVSRAHLSFGLAPRGPFSGPVLNYKSGGPGTVCLYEGHNYTGDSLCLRSGQRSRDLLLQHLDNRYSSVTIEGDVSITLCRDRDYSSYCERINDSEARLHGFLDNNVSSYTVH